MKAKSKLAYLSLILGFFLISTVQATSMSFTTQVAEITRGLNFPGETAIGLSKFDPSLGTLTAINLSAVGGYSVAFELSASIDNPEAEDEFGFFDAPHSISGEITYLGSIDIDGPGNLGLRTTIQEFTQPFACMREGDFACTDDIDIEAMGTYDASSATDPAYFTQPLLERITSNNLLDLFVGSGHIETGVLRPGLSAFFEPGLFGGLDIIASDNITIESSNGLIDGEFTLGPTAVTVEYVFTPTVVPVPAAVWLFGSALVGIGALSRRRTS